MSKSDFNERKFDEAVRRHLLYFWWYFTVVSILLGIVGFDNGFECLKPIEDVHLLAALNQYLVGNGYVWHGGSQCT